MIASLLRRDTRVAPRAVVTGRGVTIEWPEVPSEWEVTLVGSERIAHAYNAASKEYYKAARSLGVGRAAAVRLTTAAFGATRAMQRLGGTRVKPKITAETRPLLRDLAAARANLRRSPSFPTAPAAVAEPTTVAVKPAKGAAKAAWRGMSKAQRRYHCYHFRNDRAEYGRGYRLGAQLAGKSPRRARALWRGWTWQLDRKCPR